jgi:hypothetical protein
MHALKVPWWSRWWPVVLPVVASACSAAYSSVLLDANRYTSTAVVAGFSITMLIVAVRNFRFVR